MFWSIFAYFWLLVILGISSKDRVEIWEAASTLAFIPLVIITSWMAERGWLDWAFPVAKVGRRRDGDTDDDDDNKGSSRDAPKMRIETF